MISPKKLPDGIDYSGEIYSPEIDSDLKDYIKFQNELVIPSSVDGAVGEMVTLDESFIDDSQFE